MHIFARFSRIFTFKHLRNSTQNLHKILHISHIWRNMGMKSDKKHAKNAKKPAEFAYIVTYVGVLGIKTGRKHAKSTPKTGRIYIYSINMGVLGDKIVDFSRVLRCFQTKLTHKTTHKMHI